MLEKHRQLLARVRREMLAARGERDADGRFPIYITIALTAASFGEEPRWMPADAAFRELEPGQLWARPTVTTGVYDVVSCPRTRHREEQYVMMTARAQVADLVGFNGIYDSPARLPLLAIEGTATQMVLPDDHPARRYQQFMQDLEDELIWQCQFNWPEKLTESCPPMPSLRRLDDGTWQIGFLISICPHGVWDADHDGRYACFLAGMLDAYPHATWQIADDIGEAPHDPPLSVWRSVGLEPQPLQARQVNDPSTNVHQPPL